MDPKLEKEVNKLVEEYNKDYADESGVDTRLPASKLEEIRLKFWKILEPYQSSLLSEIADGNVNKIREIIFNEYYNNAQQAIKEASGDLKKFTDHLKSKCQCTSCPKYIYNEESGLYEIVPWPKDDCIYVSCAVQDSVDTVNDLYNVLKLKKIKRGSIKDANLSIRDCDSITERAKIVTAQNIEKLKNKSTAIMKLIFKNPTTYILIALIIVMILMLIYIVTNVFHSEIMSEETNWIKS